MNLLELAECLEGRKCPECKGWGEVAYFGEMVRCRCNGEYESPISMEVRQKAAKELRAIAATRS